jgi:hypothetical protein
MRRRVRKLALTGRGTVLEIRTSPRHQQRSRDPTILCDQHQQSWTSVMDSEIAKKKTKNGSRAQKSYQRRKRDSCSASARVQPLPNGVAILCRLKAFHRRGRVCGDRLNQTQTTELGEYITDRNTRDTECITAVSTPSMDLVRGQYAFAFESLARNVGQGIRGLGHGRFGTLGRRWLPDIVITVLGDSFIADPRRRCRCCR